MTHGVSGCLLANSFPAHLHYCNMDGAVVLTNSDCTSTSSVQISVKLLHIPA